MKKRYKKIVFLSSIGGALEFFDFTIYALFANYISKAFFPYNSLLVSLMKTFAIFAIGYLARPIGGVVFGHLGDKKGRRYAFTLSVLCMATSTLLIGMLPDYHIWGNAAPLLLVLLRLFQGFSVGGEIPAATVFAFEHVPVSYRGFAISIIFMCITFGNALAGGIGFILSKILSHQMMILWGWRIPFFIGFLLGIISYVLRQKTLETPIFRQMEKSKRLFNIPLYNLLAKARRSLIVSFFLTALSAATVFLFLYLPTYLTAVLGYHISFSYLMTTTSFISLAVAGVFFGWLSDKFTRKKLIIFGCLLSLVVGFYLFSLLTLSFQLMRWLFGILIGSTAAMVNGVYGVTISEQFQPEFRLSGMGLSYNLGLTLFGGLAPFLSTVFIKISGNILVPYYYFALCGLLTLAAGFFVISNKQN